MVKQARPTRVGVGIGRFADDVWSCVSPAGFRLTDSGSRTKPESKESPVWAAIRRNSWAACGFLPIGWPALVQFCLQMCRKNVTPEAAKPPIGSRHCATGRTGCDRRTKIPSILDMIFSTLRRPFTNKRAFGNGQTTTRVISITRGLPNVTPA